MTINISENKNLEIRYYNQKELWKKYENSITEIERAKKTVNLISDDVKSVLDIGCGNGIVTNMIKDRFVVALDFAKTPLMQVNTYKIQASIDKLPIKSKKFNLIILTEVLEHLDSETYIKAIKEVKRLSPNYLLISTPFNENLEIKLGKCSKCGYLFNLDHHYRSFNNQSLCIDFPEYELSKRELTNYRALPSKELIRLMHNLDVYSYSSDAICPRCGSQSVKSNQILKYVFDFLITLERVLKKIFRVKRPYHQIVLLKKTCVSEGRVEMMA